MTENREPPWLSGHSVYLRVPTVEEVAKSPWHTWYNDYHTTEHNSHGVYPINRDQEIDLVKKMLGEPGKILLGIWTKDGDHLIGNIALQAISHLHRTAEITITIGDRDFLGRPAGLEAMGLVIDHGFRRLNLNAIYAGAHEGLGNWIRMNRAIGFKEEGRRRQQLLRDGQFHDVVLFGVLRKEFEELTAQRDGNILCSSLGELMRQVAKAAAAPLAC